MAQVGRREPACDDSGRYGAVDSRGSARRSPDGTHLSRVAACARPHESASSDWKETKRWPELSPGVFNKPDPAPDPPLRPIVPALRVTKDFTCEGVRFHEGQLLAPDSPIVQAIHREYPELLRPPR